LCSCPSHTHGCHRERKRSFCHRNLACRAETIATCENIIARFDNLNPESIVDHALVGLDKLGMIRPGDVDRAQELRDWYVWRQESLPPELERYRYLPDLEGNCADGLELCGDQGFRDCMGKSRIGISMGR